MLEVLVLICSVAAMTECAVGHGARAHFLVGEARTPSECLFLAEAKSAGIAIRLNGDEAYKFSCPRKPT